jgi:hypothetical protein
MRKLGLAIAAAALVGLFAGSAMASDHKAGNTGGHFNLNIIGFAQCDQKTDTDCFPGTVDDLKFQGHRIFVPLKTKTVPVCDDASDLGNVGDTITKAQLDGGVRILVSVSPSGKMGVLDHDATDGLGKFQLPEGTYSAWARATGKPDTCVELNTLICAADEGDVPGTQEDCTGSTSQGTFFILAGFFDLAITKGGRQKWENVTDDILPGFFLGGGGNSGHTGAFDYLWEIFNDGVRVLQIRLRRES